MKRIAIAILSVALMCPAGAAFGQAGSVVIYSDAAFSSCDTQASGTLFWYLRHEGHGGATAVAFKIETHGNFIRLADSWNFPVVVGQSDVGVGIAYGACLTGPVDLGSVIYNGLGTATVCSTVDIVGDPNSPTGNIEGVDCTFNNKTFPSGSTMTVNSDGSCQCGANPVESTNWGRIKALYN